MSDFFERIDSIGGDLRTTFRLLLDDVSPMSRGPVLDLYHTYGQGYLDEATEFISTMRRRFPRAEDYDHSLEAFGDLVVQYARLSAVFQKTLDYRSLRSQSTALDTVSGEDYYVQGLMWSYLFWFNHYNLRRFFRERVLNGSFPTKDYLEIGPGHGLFLADALRADETRAACACDLNPKAVAFAAETLERLGLNSGRVELVAGDCLARSFPVLYDLCVLVEVLEHVSSPATLLSRAVTLTKPGGRIFLTTVTNVPFVDHVYQFRHPDEIRRLIETAGLRMEAECVERVYNSPESQNAFDYFGLCRVDSVNGSR